MLLELRADFEIILFSSNIEKYTTKVVSAIQKEVEMFDHVIYKDQLLYNKDLDYYSVDLNVLLGERDMKDIIVVSNTCGRYMLSLLNGIPVKEYTGNKKDLSLLALTRYLKTFVKVPDVRVKIKEDFGL
jgi:TFIIF-interacting CTD phosphatase-like protein